MSASTAPAGAKEFYCEGVDDDGDFEIDEGCPRTCDLPYVEVGPHYVAPGSIGATDVSLVRPGTGFAWAYADSRSGTSQVYVRVTATSGSQDAAEVRLSDGTHSASSARILLRSASTFAAVWIDSRDGNPEVYLRLLDAFAAPASGSVDRNVSSNQTASANPDAAWNGSGFGVVWDDTKGSNRDIYFARLDASGESIGQAVRVTSAASLQEQPSIAWDGSQYAIVWTDERDGDREIYGQRFDANGNSLDVAVRLTMSTGNSERAKVRTLQPGRFSLAWLDDRSGAPRPWYAPWQGPAWTASPGVALPSAAGSAAAVDLSTTGAEVFVAWTDTRAGTRDAFARRLRYDAVPLSVETRVTQDGLAGSSVAVAWHGSGFGVADASTSPRLVLLGCGGTDADADSFTLDGGDCNDASIEQNPITAEICDGVDNDCDGTPDEACRGTCDARPVAAPADLTVPTQTVDRLRITSGAGGYGATWQEREVYPGCCLTWAPYFAKLDSGGVPISAAVRFAPPSLSGEETWIVFNGTEFAVAWESYDRVTFVPRIAFERFDAAGDPIGAMLEVSLNPVAPFGHRRPVLVWGPNEYALTYTDIRADGSPRANVFLRLNREGRPLERPRDISPAPNSELADLSYDGTGYGLSYLYLVDPYFRRLDRFGGFVSAAVAIRHDDFDQGYNRVAATPWGYGVTWAEDTGPAGSAGQIYYERFDVAGLPQGGPVRISGWSDGIVNTQEHSLIWSGQEFLVFTYEFDGLENMVYFRIDSNGQALGTPVTVFSNDPALPSGSPWLAWNGSGPLAAWVDSDAGGLNHARPRSRSMVCCENVPAPSPISGLSWLDATTLTWTPAPEGHYDRVRGSLDWVQFAGTLEGSVLDCLNDLEVTSSSETADPSPYEASYFLVRTEGICSPGSYDDSGSSQAPSRDPGLSADPNACP